MRPLVEKTQACRYLRDWQEDFCRAVAEQYPGQTIACFYRSSSPVGALYFGNMLSKGWNRKMLHEMYPRSVWYLRSSGTFVNFMGPVAVQGLLDRDGGLLMQGSGFGKELRGAPPPGLELQPLAGSGLEQLYRVRPAH